MYPELPPSRERKRTLLTTTTNERLMSFAEKTHNLKLVDYICDLLVERYEDEPTASNADALEFALARQEAVIEINFLNADYMVEAGEDIAIEEAINEALFKPIGE